MGLGPVSREEGTEGRKEGSRQAGQSENKAIFVYTIWGDYLCNCQIAASAGGALGVALLA